MSNFHYVYILVDEATGNHFYIGCTEDLKSRLAKHNAGEVPHTSKFKPWHVSDRTGCAVTASRIVFENWSVEAAISELMQPKSGFSILCTKAENICFLPCYFLPQIVRMTPRIHPIMPMMVVRGYFSFQRKRQNTAKQLVLTPMISGQASAAIPHFFIASSA